MTQTKLNSTQREDLIEQFVEIVVVIPADLGDAEEALYKRLQEIALDTELI